MKYKGVYYDKRYRLYRVNVQSHGYHYIGSFQNNREAAKAYDRAALYYQHDPDLNFPELIKEYNRSPYNPAVATPRCSNKYLGVSYHTRRERWIAYITVDYQRINLGYFDTAIAAAKARDRAALEHCGDQAKLNFPRRNQCTSK